MNKRDGFYVRRVADHPDPLYPVYECVGNRMRLAASRIGSTDFIWEQGDRPFPAWLIPAGVTLDEAIAFAKGFYKSTPVIALQPAAQRSDGDDAHDAAPYP